MKGYDSWKLATPRHYDLPEAKPVACEVCDLEIPAADEYHHQQEVCPAHICDTCEEVGETIPVNDNPECTESHCQSCTEASEKWEAENSCNVCGVLPPVSKKTVDSAGATYCHECLPPNPPTMGESWQAMINKHGLENMARQLPWIREQMELAEDDAARNRYAMLHDMISKQQHARQQ